MATTDRLTERRIKNATAADKSLSDGGGLSLELMPTGSRLWRFRYRRPNGRENMLSFGKHPDRSLADARAMRNEAKALIDKGVDPSEARQAKKADAIAAADSAARVAAGQPAVGSFKELALRWLATRSPEWSPSHAANQAARLEIDLFPYIGDRPAAEIKPAELLKVIRKIEAREAVESAHRVKNIAGMVFRFGIAEGVLEANPARDIGDAIRRPPPPAHIPAIVDPARYAQLLRVIPNYHGLPQVRALMMFSVLVFARASELRLARWDEMDLESATWTIPAARMKGTRVRKVRGPDHVVGLSRQAVEVLKSMLPLTGGEGYVFPGLRTGQPLGVNSINTALTLLDFPDQRGHGFRASARTMLAERLRVDPAVVEAHLAHAVAGPLGRSYDRTEFMDQRRAMLQQWADHVDRLRAGDNVVTLIPKSA